MINHPSFSSYCLELLDRMVEITKMESIILQIIKIVTSMKWQWEDLISSAKLLINLKQELMVLNYQMLVLWPTRVEVNLKNSNPLLFRENSQSTSKLILSRMMMFNPTQPQASHPLENLLFKIHK